MSTQHNDDDSRTTSGISRRSLLAVGAVGIPSIALVACSQADSPSTPAAAPSSGSSAGSSAAGSSAAGSSAASGAKVLAKLSDIKVGEAISATSADGKDIVISRPTQTTVAAFSAICTHQGCTVQPAGKTLDCPCHGSVYNALTGEVVNGPAQRSLPALKVTLSGDNVVAG